MQLAVHRPCISHVVRHSKSLPVPIIPSCVEHYSYRHRNCNDAQTWTLDARPLQNPIQTRLPSAIALNATNSASSDDGKSSSAWLEVFLLGTLFAAWYLANIFFNIYNKEVLKVFPLPLTCTTAQFGVGSVLALVFWGTGMIKRPSLSLDMVLRITPLAVVHTLGNLLTNVSLGSVAVSFTHTIKAMEPIFSVALSALFLGDKPDPLVLLTLLPIMGGVILASVSEVTFNWRGFLAAMGSNLTFQSRNVLSKKMMSKSTDASRKGGAKGYAGLDNINLFSIITCLSFLILLPANLAVEGWHLTPQRLAQMGITNTNDVLTKVLLAGVCFHAYQQVSYMILSRVTPVTHSIGNSVKRVMVIVASVFVFKNPLTVQSAAGTAVALLGVFLYSQAKRASKQQSKASP